MTLLILFFLLSIIFSFLCSIWEAVLLSIPPAHVEIKLKDGGRVGVLLKRFKTNIDRPLAAILTLNTIAHTAGAIGVGAQAAHIWSEAYWDLNLGFSTLHINVAAVIVPTVMTICILILSEIIPKTLGANYWKSLTSFTVSSIQIIIWILSPFVWLSQLITKTLKKDKDSSVLSRTDYVAMAEIGEKEGVIAANESIIIKNLFRFNLIHAKDIMTPRTVVQAAHENTTVEEFYNTHEELRFSRIPIFAKSKDHISSYVLKGSILTELVKGNTETRLKELAREMLIVPEKKSIRDVFEELVKKNEHIALVVDQYGGMSGIITMEDIIETLFGLEIVDELDNIEDMQALARKIWNERAQKLGLIKPN